MSVVAVEPWDFRHPEGIDRSGLVALRGVAEGFGRVAGGRIGSLLHNRVQIRLDDLRQTNWGEFDADLARPAVLASFDLVGYGPVIVHLPIDLAMVLIDLHLSGAGSGPFPSRVLSDMERQIVAPMLEVVAQETAAAISAVLGHVEAAAVTQLVVPASQARARDEQCVLLRFHVRLAQVADDPWLLDLCIPTAVLRPLLDRLVDGPDRHEAPVLPAVERAARALPLTLSLRFAQTAVSLSVAENLAVDQVLSLGHPLNTPLLVHVQDRPVFTANLVTEGKRAACQIVAYIDPED